MDAPRITLSLDTIRTLKCAVCDNYLTVPPITITSLNGNEWKCGRCAFVSTNLSIPALLFETVAMSMTFPCIHANCPDELPWEEIRAHEESCPFQPVKCPCGETIDNHLALWHFRQNHADIISCDKAVLEQPGYCKLLTRLILKNNTPFIVYILCERKADIKVGVYSLQDAINGYEFQLGITTSGTSSSITLPSQKIPKFDVRENCADCLLKTCKVKYHKYYESIQDPLNNAVYETMQVRVNTLSVLNILDSDEYILTITVSERDVVNEEVTLSKNERIRKSWECQICQEYLVGSIFICPTGHSLCGSCKSKLENCPYCVMVIGESRNFTLEEMAEDAEIVCQYEGKGCNFSGNVQRIAKHEGNCYWNKVGELQRAKKLKFTA